MISLGEGGGGLGYQVVNTAPRVSISFIFPHTEKQMSVYPSHISRCQHIKVNGTQCGSPSLRETKYCYYHIRYHWPELDALEDKVEWFKPLPTLEDANSIQVSLAKVMEQLVTEEIDHKTAALWLYALQIASMNLKRTSLEPALPTQVIIDRESVAQRPIGASAWSRVQGREYDDLTAENDGKSNDNDHDNDNGNDNAQQSLQKYLPEPTASKQPS